MKAIILAAGRGSRMGKLTEDQPKCLTLIDGRTLLERALANACEVAGRENVIVVGGYKSQLLRNYHSNVLVNDKWASTNIMGSLMMLNDELLNEECTIVYSDILFDPQDLSAVFHAPAPALLSVSNWLEVWSNRFERPLEDLEGFRLCEGGQLQVIGGRVKCLDQIEGQFGGIFKVSPHIWSGMISEYQEGLSQMDSTSTIMKMIERGAKFAVIPSVGDWFEFDRESDVSAYVNMLGRTKLRRFDRG
jgi:choline kinase